MGANLRWFTACGAPEHFNACLKTFAWYFVEYLTNTQRQDIPVPYAALPEDCPHSDDPTEDPVEDPSEDPVDDPTDPEEDPNDPVEDPSCPKDDPSDPETKQKKCVALAEQILLKRESKCIGNRSKLKLKTCAWFKRRENCRKRTDRLAKKFSKICGQTVGLIRTADAPPSECEACEAEFLEK